MTTGDRAASSSTHGIEIMDEFAPYKARHAEPNGAGDARPTALEIVRDEDLVGKLTGKVALITGCTSGIGKAASRVQ